MPPAAIALGAAAVGAGGSIIAGNKAASAQKSAANQAAALQEAQNAEARRQYDTSREDLAPYRQAGYTALGQLGAGTVNGGEFNRNFTMADYQADPGYQFRLDQGNRGVEASAAARGGALSGATEKALARYNQDYASNEYGAAYNRFNNDTSTRYNRLASIAGVGQTATNSGIAAGNALTGQLQQGVNNQTDALNGAANARSSQYVNAGQQIGKFATNAGNYLSLSDLYSNANLSRLTPGVDSMISSNSSIF